MARNKELSKADKLYLETNRDVDVKELSKDVNVTLNVVREYVDNLPAVEKVEEKDPTEQNKDIPKVEEKNPHADVSDLMGRNERYGAVVSTPSASQVSDSTRHHRINKGNKTESMIHRCKPKKK